MVGSSGISFSGLSSGIDTQAIVRQLVQLERLPIQTISARRANEQRKSDLVGQLGDLVKKLKEKAEALKTSDEFKSNSATISDESIGTVTAEPGAIAGSHTLEVQRLAATDRWVFDAVSSRDQDISTTGGQQVSFTVGQTAYSLTVDPSRSSLDEIAADLNDMAGDEISASVVNTGTTSNPSYQLVLASKVPGEDGRITNIFSDVAGTGDALTIAWSAPDGNGAAQSAANITVGNDALAEIDGLSVRRSSNDFSDVIEGLSISATRTTTPGDPAIVTVEPDRDAVRGKIDEFVSAYNAVQSFINTQSTFTPSEDPNDNGGKTGLLFGDSILTNVRSALSRSLFSVDIATVTGDSQGYSTLSLVGIKRDRSGLLSVDETKFNAKFADNLDALADLFADDDGFDNGGVEPGDPNYYVDQSADKGLMSKLVGEIDRMFGTLAGSTSELTLRGVFDAKQEALKARIKLFDQDIARKEDRVTRYQETLTLQYARFEELMTRLNSQGASLTNTLG
ncbi:MAG: flagellar filament capping protein FliD [Planctomycetota bacterium]